MLSTVLIWQYQMCIQSSLDTHTKSHNTMLLIVHLPHCCHTVSPSPSHPVNFPEAAALLDGKGSDRAGRASKYNAPYKYRTGAF